MNEPLTLLFIGLLIVLFFIALLYPNKGLLAIWKKSKYTSKKALIEDALKYLYNCEYNGINCTLNGIAGNLSISADDATDILSRLESMGMVSTQKDEFKINI